MAMNTQDIMAAKTSSLYASVGTTGFTNGYSAVTSAALSIFTPTVSMKYVYPDNVGSACVTGAAPIHLYRILTKSLSAAQTHTLVPQPFGSRANEIQLAAGGVAASVYDKVVLIDPKAGIFGSEYLLSAQGTITVAGGATTISFTRAPLVKNMNQCIKDFKPNPTKNFVEKVCFGRNGTNQQVKTGTSGTVDITFNTVNGLEYYLSGQAMTFVWYPTGISTQQGMVYSVSEGDYQVDTADIMSTTIPFNLVMPPLPINVGV